MSARAQVKHLLLDVNFKDKPQVVNLEAEFNPLARLFYMDLMAAMSSATDARITKAVARVLGSRIGIAAEESSKIIQFCLETGLLQLEGDMITNARVIKDQESYARKLESSNARVTRYREKKEPLQTMRETRTPDTDYDTDNDLKNDNGVANTPDYSHITDPAELKKLETAEELLVPCSSPAIQNSNQFLLVGKRPMREWSHIWLTPFEMVKVLDELHRAGMDKADRRAVFDKVQARITTKVGNGERVEKISAFNYLTGFELTNAIDQLGKKKNLERQTTYANNAREK